MNIHAKKYNYMKNEINAPTAKGLFEALGGIVKPNYIHKDETLEALEELTNEFKILLMNQSISWGASNELTEMYVSKNRLLNKCNEAIQKAKHLEANKKTDVNKALIKDLVFVIDMAISTIEAINEYFISENITPQTSLVTILKNAIQKAKHLEANKKTDVNNDLISVNNDLVIAAELAIRCIQMTNEYFITKNITPRTSIIDLLKISIKKAKHESI